jgi:nucleotide-binding universal stress UspA family protein
MGGAPDGRPAVWGEDVLENARRWREMIMVGVDGSTSSRDAIRWAIDEARLRKTKVDAVFAWQSPLVVGTHYIPPDLIDPQALSRHAEEIVEAAVAEAGAASDVEIESRAVEGAPARVLLAESRDADLLVLGSRGHGGFSELLLGSVGQQCVHHAACPVVIVRPARSDDNGRST